MTQPIWQDRLDELLEDYSDRFSGCSEDNDELIDLLLTERSELLEALHTLRG